MTPASAGSPKGGDAKQAPSRSDNIAVGRQADAPNPCFTTPNPLLEGVELREAYARVRIAMEEPYTEGVWEGSNFNTDPFATVRIADLEALIQATPLIGLSQGEGRKWLGDVVAAMVAARYQPGDHPIVPTKIAAFIDKAEEMLPRVLSALSGLSLPGRDAREAIARAVHRGRFPADRVPSPFEMEDARGKEYCFRIADQIIALSTVQDGSVRDDAGQWTTADEQALHERARDLLDTAGEEMLRIEPNATVWVTRNSALRAIIHLIEPARRSTLPQSPAPISGDAS
jgi:hypothetical protein